MSTLRHHPEQSTSPQICAPQDISHGELAFVAMVETYILTEDPDRAHAEYINTLKEAI